MLDYSKQKSTQCRVDDENFGDYARISGKHCRFISSGQCSGENPAETSIHSQGKTERAPDRGHFGAKHGFFTLPKGKWQPNKTANALADQSAAGLYNDFREFPGDGVFSYLVQ
jgi:hypothetical protein